MFYYKIGLKRKFEEEVARFKKFQKGMLGIAKPEKSDKEIDIRTYAKYVLREGSIIEKRELLGCLKSRLVIKNKAVILDQ